MPQLALYNECTGCLACVDSCNQEALRYSVNEEGHIVPVLNNKLCLNCGACEKACPVVSHLPYSSSPKSEAFAAWARDWNVRRNSATAGAFASMAQYVLSQGGIVCGAANIDGLHVCHICISSLNDLHKLQGSKYTQSNSVGIFKEVYSYLKNGRLVLFSGTGCQVAGLFGFLGGKKYKGKLITIDLICGGVPSRLLIDKFVKCAPYNVKRIVSFRSKDNGWAPQGYKYNLKVEDQEGMEHDYTDIRNLITTGFACEMTNRYSCYKCHFSGLNRMSDFTIGDYWGVSKFEDQHKEGVSVIIAHNDNAISILEDAKEYIEIHDADILDILSHNKRLGVCKDNRYKLPERKFMSKLFSRLSYDNLNKIYAFGFSNRSPWMLYKVYRTIITKIIDKL